MSSKAKKGTGKVAKPKKTASKTTKGKGELSDAELEQVSGGTQVVGARPNVGERVVQKVVGGVVVSPGPFIKGSTGHS